MHVKSEREREVPQAASPRSACGPFLHICIYPIDIRYAIYMYVYVYVSVSIWDHVKRIINFTQKAFDFAPFAVVAVCRMSPNGTASGASAPLPHSLVGAWH